MSAQNFEVTSGGQESVPAQIELPPLPDGYDHTRELESIRDNLLQCGIARRRYSGDPTVMARLDELEAGYRQRMQIWEARDLPYTPRAETDPLFDAMLSAQRAELGLVPAIGYEEFEQ